MLIYQIKKVVGFRSNTLEDEVTKENIENSVSCMAGRLVRSAQDILDDFVKRGRQETLRRRQKNRFLEWVGTVSSGY